MGKKSLIKQSFKYFNLFKSSNCSAQQQQEVPTYVYLIGCAQHPFAPHILPNICQLAGPLLTVLEECSCGLDPPARLRYQSTTPLTFPHDI